MKEFIFSVVILTLIFALSIFNSAFLKNFTDTGIGILKNIIDGKSDIGEFSDFFESHADYINFVSRFTDITTVQNGIDTVKNILKDQASYPDYELNYRLEELKRSFAKLFQNDNFSFSALF